MYLKNVLYVVAIAAIFSGIFFWGSMNSSNTGNSGLETASSAEAASGKRATLTTDERFYDFGTISMKNGDVMREFTVFNKTSDDVYLKKIYTSCMCTTAYLVGLNDELKGPFGMIGHGAVPPANETIKAGESRKVRIVFNPNAHGPAGVGRIDRVVTLTEGDGSTLDLNIKALVTP